MEGTRPLRGQPYPTFKCGQNVKSQNRRTGRTTARVLKTAFVLMLTLKYWLH